MQDKKARQLEAKKKHRENLKNARRKKKDIERPEPVKIEKPSILIVCEGKNTEPSYFRKFRLSSADIHPVGEGYNTVSLVNRAKQLGSEKSYDQVWCVFDKDDFNSELFNTAVRNANAFGYGVAYSNQAFEFWLILHLSDHQGGGMHRSDYDDKLNELLAPFKVVYDGKSSKLITDDIFEILDGVDEFTNKERKVLAINRAKSIYGRLDNTNPASEESSTTVFKLVEELLKYI